jgi:hypothetical protein
VSAIKGYHFPLKKTGSKNKNNQLLQVQHTITGSRSAPAYDPGRTYAPKMRTRNPVTENPLLLRIQENGEYFYGMKNTPAPG